MGFDLLVGWVWEAAGEAARSSRLAHYCPPCKQAFPTQHTPIVNKTRPSPPSLHPRCLFAAAGLAHVQGPGHQRGVRVRGRVAPSDGAAPRCGRLRGPAAAAARGLWERSTSATSTRRAGRLWDGQRGAPTAPAPAGCSRRCLRVCEPIAHGDPSQAVTSAVGPSSYPLRRPGREIRNAYGKSLHDYGPNTAIGSGRLPWAAPCRRRLRRGPARAAAAAPAGLNGGPPVFGSGVPPPPPAGGPTRTARAPAAAATTSPEAAREPRRRRRR